MKPEVTNEFIYTYAHYVTESICEQYDVDPSNLRLRAILAWNMQNPMNPIMPDTPVSYPMECPKPGTAFLVFDKLDSLNWQSITYTNADGHRVCSDMFSFHGVLTPKIQIAINTPVVLQTRGTHVVTIDTGHHDIVKPKVSAVKFMMPEQEVHVHMHRELISSSNPKHPMVMKSAISVFDLGHNNIASFVKDDPLCNSYVRFYNYGAHMHLSVDNVCWEGTVEYSLDGVVWSEWTGEHLESCSPIYLRGVGNTLFNDMTAEDLVKLVNFTGHCCSGKRDALIDYHTLEGKE